MVWLCRGRAAHTKWAFTATSDEELTGLPFLDSWGLPALKHDSTRPLPKAIEVAAAVFYFCLERKKVKEPAKVCVNDTCRKNTSSSHKTLKIKVPVRWLLVARWKLLTPAFTSAGLLGKRGGSFWKSLRPVTIVAAKASTASVFQAHCYLLQSSSVVSLKFLPFLDGCKRSTNLLSS